MTDTGKAVVELSANALKVLQRRYLKKGEDGQLLETPEEMFRRVARAVAQAERLYNPAAPVEQWETTFYELLTSLEFLPNSPTLMNAGRELGQLSACFVLPVGDSMESIFEAIKNTALIHKSGGGTGFSFSRVRPHNDVVLSTKGVSSGPLSFMSVFDAATETIKQGGTRRGANMGIMRVDHPDILDFISAKQDDDRLNNFNISVAVTDAFMRAVEADEEYPLVNPRSGETVRTLSARKVFKSMVTLAWKNGDPGIVFIDRINEDNPTPHLGDIESTNPCGEQPLLPYESCNLGSINLARVVPDGHIDYGKLGRITRTAVRFLDDVIDVNRYPLPEIEQMTKGNRKIGLGVMGFADMLLRLQVPYDSEEACRIAGEVMGFIHDEARAESEELARERGVFPNFEGSVFDRPDGARVRNATVTTIAPTGTISIIAGCSSGIEPLFALSYVRANVLDDDRMIESHPYFEQVARERGFYGEELMKRIAEVGSARHVDGIPADVQQVFATAHDITPEWHIRLQAAFQKSTDNAVSKTVNFPNEATVEDVENVYRMAFRTGCKGVTIYRDGSRDEQVLNVGQSKKKREPEPGVGIATTRPARPQLLTGETQRMDTGCGKLFVIMNDDEYGAREVFANMGKAGGCASSNTEALGRLISLALKKGASPQEVVEQLKGIRCHVPYGVGPNATLSCADAIGKALERRYVTGAAAKAGSAPEPQLSLVEVAQGACPDCGGAIEHEGGCAVCRTCGYSKCG
ncbi:MAG: vitamin B12-dependent ribonucleotide reductase [Actinobacteria bacterium]|nr:vitamin B12-dependent ribonucleotide reductase [Actinomycetota bacterium]